MDTIGNFGIAQVEDDMEQKIFTLDADRSNSMKSANPNSGIHESNVAKTLDTTTPTPQKAQGGQMIVAYDARGNGDGKTANTITGDHANRVTDFTPIVASFMGGQGAKAGGIGYEENVSSTIKAAPSGGNQVPDIVCFHGSQDPISNTEHANAVNRNNGLENCICQYGESAGMLTERHDSSPCAHREQNVVASHLSVRRLLPIETERLMGFPEIDVLEVYRMTKDEFIAFEIATGNIIVDAEKGLVYTTRGGHGRKLDTPRLLEGTETPTGYLVVSLREKNDKRQVRIHRIIWTAVHGIIPEGMTIDHINNDKHDNRIENLQLMTAVDNSKKAHEEGIVPHHKKFTEEQDFEAFSLYVNGMKVKDILLRMGMSKGRFYELLNRVGWTQIPWRGKPADECPDAPRYKACGNSMGVNCMRWIGLGIEMVEVKHQK